MKSIITTWYKSALRLGVVLMLSTFGNSLMAQSPWCNAPHQSTCGWGTTVAYTTDQIEVKNSSGTSIYKKGADGCNNTIGGTAAYALINAGSSFDMFAGGAYTIDVTFNSAVYTGAKIGIYIDLNGDKDFNDAGEFINPNTANSGWSRGVARTLPFTIPCSGLVAGATRLRVRGGYQYVQDFGATDGCNSSYYYGETEDFNIELKLPTSLSANFVVPTTVYTDYDYTFFNTSQAAIYLNEWDKDADGTYDATSSNYFGRWSVASNSTKCLKLRANNCLGSDSSTKCFTVVVPTQVPKVDFIANKTTTDLFSIGKLNDLTDFGPTSWSWEVYDSSNPVDIKTTSNGAAIYVNGTSRFSKNPELLYLKSGYYKTCLTATNGVGPSSRVCKDSYVRVLPLQDFRLGNGPSATAEANGRIYDHNGPDLNYTNNRNANVDKLLINPCGALSIDFEFSQIKFADVGDSLIIYAGENPAAPRAAAIGRGNVIPNKITVQGGAAYLTFTSNGSGVDSGFIGTYRANLGPGGPPAIDFDLPTVGYFGVELDLINKSTNVLGLPNYSWEVYEPDGPVATATYATKDTKHTFFTTGVSKVCLTIEGCAGSATKCKSISVSVPNTKTSLDYVANNRRPDITETIQMTTTADKANKFQWSVFPITATITTPTSKNPTVKFTASGAYTFTLRAWNSNDSAATVTTLVKDKYVIVVDYCKPVVQILSGDVGISNFKLTKSGVNLINSPSTAGVTGYTDYSATRFAKGTFGATYDFEIKRPSGVDAANTKVWVDFNINGTFEASELVGNFASSKNTTLTGSFTVPAIANSFIGNARIRVSMAYGNTANTSCGPILAGEVEDYGMALDNDKMPPMISLIGADTMYVERVIAPNPPNYVDAGATATDPTEGNITSKIVSSTDFDQTTAGIYTYTYCITDASGNGPVCVTRTVYVVLDRTNPVLTLNGASAVSICSDIAYTDPGAKATDNVDGDLTPSITVIGSVNTAKVGVYVLTYSVSDVQGNKTSDIRTVEVKDCEKPVIEAVGTENIQINTIWADQTTVTDNYYDGIRAKLVELIRTPGANGFPNTTKRGSYPVTYTAVDSFNNAATPVLRNYRVDDFIAPVIDLKTLDTVYHNVNNPYYSTNAQVTDNFYPSSQVSLTRTGSVDAYTLGTYTETFIAVDASGNRDTAIRYVKVVDVEKPVIFAPVINGCVGHGIDNLAGVQLSDNYDAPSAIAPRIRFIQNNVNIWEAGVYSMTYEVSDLSGNVSNPFTRTVFMTYCRADLKVGVETVSIENATTVYPNPTNGTINIKVADIYNQNVTVTVYNAVGTQVATASDANGSEISIDLNNQAAGLYLVKVTTGGQTTTKKVTLTK